MPLPTLELTWQFSVNQTLYYASTTLNSRLPSLGVVNSMIGFASNPWIVWGSSGVGGYGNDDGVDYWQNDPNNLVTGQSWIVIENQINGMQLMFDSSGSYAYQGTIRVSFAGGFGAPVNGGTGADGTASTPPTAADQVTLLSNGTWTQNSPVTHKLHVMHSSDGELTYIILCYNSNPIWIGLLGSPATPIAPLVLPVGGFLAQSIASQGDYGDWNSNAKMYAQISSTNFACYLTCEGSQSNMVGEDMGWPDDDTGEWPMMPIGLFSATGSHRGRKASMYDLWWGSTALATGSTFPGDASNQFAKFGSLIFPWNGTVPEVS